MPSKSGGVLVVKDNPADARSVIRALSGLGVQNVAWARNAPTALSLLRSASIRPSLILLDLNLSESLLGSLKREESLWDVPLVLLSSVPELSNLKEWCSH